jgi:general secretion pathway protein F
MPVYAYKGMDSAGKSTSGTREAENPRAIKQFLRRDGIFLTDLKESGPTAKKKSEGAASFQFKLFAEKVSTEDLAVSTRQLSTLVGAGISLVESLTALIDQVENQTLKGVWAAVKQRVNEGAPMAEALGEHPKVFTGLYISMVRAGESSGGLDVVLDRLADFTESQADLRSKLVGAMVYPALMITILLLVVGMLFVLVIPKITKIFESQKMALPLPTQILIGISNFMIDYWFVMFVASAVGVYFGGKYIRTKKGRAKWDLFLLRAPLFGPLVRMVAISRFCKTLSTLMASGVPLLNAFDIVKNVVQNTVLLEVIETARDCVKEGDSIAAPLKRSGHFPPMVVHMIGIGEKSGQLEPMLDNIAKSYESQTETRVKTMTTLLEPLIMIAMGFIVGSVVFAILMPMLQMSSAI